MNYEAKHDVAFNINDKHNTILKGELIRAESIGNDKVFVVSDFGRKEFDKTYLFAFKLVEEKK